MLIPTRLANAVLPIACSGFVGLVCSSNTRRVTASAISSISFRTSSEKIIDLWDSSAPPDKRWALMSQLKFEHCALQDPLHQVLRQFGASRPPAGNVLGDRSDNRRNEIFHEILQGKWWSNGGSENRRKLNRRVIFTSLPPPRVLDLPTSSLLIYSPVLRIWPPYPTQAR
jgi:hypothetical protein